MGLHTLIKDNIRRKKLPKRITSMSLGRVIQASRKLESNNQKKYTRL